MVAYIIFYMIVLVLTSKIKKDKFSIYDVILLTVLILFSGLRCVGLDYKLYSYNFNNLVSLESRTGIGFSYIMYLFKYVMKLDYQSLIFTISMITNINFYYFFKKKSENPAMAILVYISLGFYTTSFNMFRQSLSISMVLIGSLLFDNKKYVKSVLVYTAAFLIHSSSLIAIVTYTVMKLFRTKKIKFKYVFALSTIAILLYDKFFYTVITLINGYSMYSTYDTTPGIGTYINVFCYLFFAIFFFIPIHNKKEENDNYIYNLFLIGLGIMLIEVKNFLFFRIAFYFTILSPLILTTMYNEHNFKNRKLEKLMYYSCLFVYFLVYIYSFDGVVPYNMFFLK